MSIKCSNNRTPQTWKQKLLMLLAEYELIPERAIFVKNFSSFNCNELSEAAGGKHRFL